MFTPFPNDIVLKNSRLFGDIQVCEGRVYIKLFHPHFGTVSTSKDLFINLSSVLKSHKQSISPTSLAVLLLLFHSFFQSDLQPKST